MGNNLYYGEDGNVYQRIMQGKQGEECDFLSEASTDQTVIIDVLNKSEISLEIFGTATSVSTTAVTIQITRITRQTFSLLGLTTMTIVSNPTQAVWVHVTASVQST